MSKLVLTDGKETVTEVVEGAQAQPLRLPPLRKFAVSRYAGQRDPEIVTGHAIDAFGHGGLAIVEYKQVGEATIPTFPRIFAVWTDLRELEMNSLKTN